MRLFAMLNTEPPIAEDGIWNTPEPASAPQQTEAMRDYEARCCHICRARYPSFGFGPPLTRPSATLWACSKHRAEVDRMMTRGRAALVENEQPLLL